MAEPRDALEVRVDDEARRPGSARASARSGRAGRRRRGRARARPRRSATTWPRESCPAGSSRAAVRGLRASISASIRRFSAIASERAPTIATVIQSEVVRRRHAAARARNAPTYANGSAKTVCSIFTSRAKRRGSGDGRRRSCLPVRASRSPASKLERVRERGLQDGVAVAAAAGRAGQVDDERRADDAGDAAREQRVRRLARARRRESPRAIPGASRSITVARRLGRDVARREPGAAGREHEPRVVGELARSRRRSRRRSSGTTGARRRSPSPRAAPRAGRRSRPRASPARDAVRDGQHGGLHTGSFVFSTSVDVGDDHLLVDRLRHVVDGQRRDRGRSRAPPSRHRSARSSRPRR